ncbi:MAG TPA: PKD domain-containing protein [Thermoplasmata archaeon]|nr:PKD domain-containing protein [Thermoplasmata archaeon]
MHRSHPPWYRAALVLAVVALAAVPGISWRSGATSIESVRFTPTVSSALVPAGPVEVAPGLVPGVGTESLGPLPSTTPLAVVVGLASKDPAGLAAWDAAAGTPGTPEFRHPLSASEAAARFGPLRASEDAAVRYFEQFGLSASAPGNGLLLDVTGPSGAVARAFGTSFDEYRLPSGRIFYGHPSAAELPPVAPWTGALGLGNETPLQPAVRATTPSAQLPPATGCTSGPGGGFLPCTIEGAYSITPLLGSTNGTGERVAVVDAYSGSETESDLQRDLASFATGAGISVGAVNYLYPVPSATSLNSSGVNPDWGLEEALDLEWARAIAPGATIEMTFSPNSGAGLYEAIDWLVSHGATDVISLSWGEPDVGVYNAFSTSCSAGCNASTDGSYALLGPVLELAAAEGISVFAASGDCGSADGTSGVATNFPASDPYVTGVGGTTLAVTGSAWSAEAAWGGNHSGRSAPGCANQGGSGGGYAPFPRPWWQLGLPVGRTERGVPDVAMVANTSTAVSVYYAGSWSAVGGTSIGTPIWAAIGAIADQYAHGDLGLLNPSLYQIGAGGRHTDDFHDIVSGSNGYRARTGWDPVTGLGSPIVSQLVLDLSQGGGFAGGGLAAFLSASVTSGSAPLAVTFTLTASGGSGSYPLEGVSFGDSNASLTKNGTVRYTFDAPGVYLAQSFVYDSGGNTSVSPPLTIVVGGGTTLAVSLQVSPGAPAVGVSVTFRATVTGGTAPYAYDFWFGDGGSADGLAANSTTHTFPAAGRFCAVVGVTDSARPSDGGSSPVDEVAVGGASGAACGNGSAPLAVTPLPSPGIRDAPADFPALFNVSGGATGNGHPPPTIAYAATDPYVAACACLILRHSGNYSVAETAVDALGARANNSTQVTVAPPLLGSFTASTLAGPVPLLVDFTASVTGGYRANASDTSWAFGTLGTETGSAVAWTFSTPGEYFVTARSGDAGDGNASEGFLVDAEPSSGPAPVGITGTVRPAVDVDSGTTVQFTGTIVGASGPTTLFWSFEGGASAAGPVTNETYFSAGFPSNDTLWFHLTPEGPDYESIGAPVRVAIPSFLAIEANDFEPAADALSLTAAVTPGFGALPLPVDATGSTSGPGGASLAWKFGSLGTGAGTSASFTFAAARNFTVVANASDPYGDTAIRSTVVAVTEPLVVEGGPSTMRGTAPLAVTFAATATGGDGQYLFLWTFGDGGWAAAPIAATTFSTPGTYTVVLGVSDAHFQTVAENWTITVNAPSALALVILAGGAAVGVLLAVVLGRESRRRGPPVSP